MRWPTAIGALLLIVTALATAQSTQAQMAPSYEPASEFTQTVPVALPKLPMPSVPPPAESPGFAESAPTSESGQAVVGYGSPQDSTTTTPNDLSAKVDELSKKLTVTTGNENFQLQVGGKVVADFVFGTNRPIAAGTPFFLAPGSAVGFEQQSFEAHARQSQLYAKFTGPTVGGFQTGGLFLAAFYDVNLIADQYGFLPLEAFGELRNEKWRFAAGLQFDIFNPLVPTVLPLTLLSATGNTGNSYRGQARVVRFFRLSDRSQVRLQGGISEPVGTFFDSAVGLLSEDNGWPNVEGRLAVELGPLGEGPLPVRPFEFGVSGVVGQLRNTEATSLETATRVVADVWGIGADLRWAITERFGIRAEGNLGQALGTYGGAILATVNPDTFAGVRSSGGFGEVYYYLVPEALHVHFGYGIDDPVDQDLGGLQLRRNEIFYTTFLWNVNESIRLGFQTSYRESTYPDSPLLPDNDGVIFHTQVSFSF